MFSVYGIDMNSRDKLMHHQIYNERHMCVYGIHMSSRDKRMHLQIYNETHMCVYGIDMNPQDKFMNFQIFILYYMMCGGTRYWNSVEMESSQHTTTISSTATRRAWAYRKHHSSSGIAIGMIHKHRARM